MCCVCVCVSIYIYIYTLTFVFEEYNGTPLHVLARLSRQSIEKNNITVCFQCFVLNTAILCLKRSLLKLNRVQVRRSYLARPFYCGRADHVRTVSDSKQRTGIGKYSFVNRTIKNWNQLPAEALGNSPRKPKIFRNRVGKAIRSGMKRKERKCG